MKKAFFRASFVIASFALAATAPLFASAATCIDLTANMSRGASDATTAGQVTVLQKYLASEGYLSATPNGYFGPATEAAVRIFQTVSGISSAGAVGPLTRAFIDAKTCATAASATSPSTAMPSLEASSNTLPTAPSMAPRSGETLSLGQTYDLSWPIIPKAYTYNVILEDANGTPQGFIVSGSYSRTSSWQIGRVRNSRLPGATDVPPGSYRIHIEDAAVGGQSGDPISGTFALVDKVYVSQLFPTTVPADGKTSIVMYGSGFNRTSLVDIYGYGLFAPAYISNDGSVIVFSVPSAVSPGLHSVSIRNTYQGSDIATESASSDITVVRS